MTLRNTVTGVKQTPWGCNFPPTYKGGVEWLLTKVWHEVVTLQNQPRLWIGHGYWEFPIEMLLPQKRWSKNQHNLSRLKIFETFWMKAPPPGNHYCIQIFLLDVVSPRDSRDRGVRKPYLGRLQQLLLSENGPFGGKAGGIFRSNGDGIPWNTNSHRTWKLMPGVLMNCL